MTFIGALDQGTSSTRFMIFDADARVIASHQLEHTQIFPNPGWVEHDGAEIWLHTQEVIAGALAKAGIKSNELKAIGITNQRETTIAWDVTTGKPLHNALVWQDTRTAELMDNLSQLQKELIIHRTGLAIAPYFSASKMKWLIQNVPAVAAAVKAGTARIGTMDSWILWNLSKGTFATDVTNASRTALMSLETLDWDPELLALFEIPREVLPEIKPTSHIFAQTPEGVPIAALVGDDAQVVIEKCDVSVGPTGVDLTTKWQMRINGSITATGLASFEMPENQSLIVHGEKGSVELIGTQAFTSWHESSTLRIGEQIEAFDAVDPYRLMIENFGKKIQAQDSWVLPLETSVSVAKVLEQIQSSH